MTVEHAELTLLGILAAIAALGAISGRIGVPYPIVLVVGGIGLGLVPGMPDVALEPDLVLLVILPPLLFNAAYFSSLGDLRANARPVALLSIGLVGLTTCTVAVVAHALIDGLPWAAAFALGAIVSPTDPLAATAIARRLGAPRQLVNTIEGESLVNDGTALVLYGAAVAVAVGGDFDAAATAVEFLVDIVGGIAVGALLSLVLRPAFRFVVNDVMAGVTLSLFCSYAAYLPAEELGLSGVLAAVTLGLALSRHYMDISSPAARLEGSAFWNVLVFLLNATLFLLVGLQLPSILEAQERPTSQLLMIVAAVTLAVLATRMLWMLAAPSVIRTLDRRRARVARRPPLRLRVVAAWAGLRGAVSLAAALALPADFAERDLLLLCAFGVIVWTLVVQGLTLPTLIRALGVEVDADGAREQLLARRHAAQAAIDRLEQLRGQGWAREDTAERMLGMYRFRLAELGHRAVELDQRDDDRDARSRADQRMVRDVLETQRRAVLALRDQGMADDEALHVIERELDLEEELLEDL